jgi:hypothetical protein
MNTLQVLALIFVLSITLGLLKGLENPKKLLALIIAVLLFNEYYKKEGFETTEEDKYKF